MSGCTERRPVLRHREGNRQQRFRRAVHRHRSHRATTSSSSPARPPARPRMSPPMTSPGSPSRWWSEESWARPTHELEKLILSHKLAQGVPRSPAGWRPAGNLMPAKDKSTERIDSIVALSMALGRRHGRMGAGPRYAYGRLSGALSPTRRPRHAAGAWALGFIPGRIRRSEWLGKGGVASCPYS
jgi:hypothetical protein